MTVNKGGKMHDMAFDQLIAARICERIAEGETLDSICSDDDMPSAPTVRRWALENEQFAADSARAYALGYETLAEQCLRIADTPMIGQKTKVSADGVEVTEGDMIEHRRLRIDTRMRLLGKWAPKRYGDKIEHSGPGGGPIPVAISAATATDDELARVAMGGKPAA